MEKFKAGDKVEFNVKGKVWQGTMVNPAHYPARNAGKHYRIDVGGVTATIFANGASGKTLTKIKAA